MNVITVGKRAREQRSHEPRGGRAGPLRLRKLPRGVLNFGQLRGRNGGRAAGGRTCAYRASETPGCLGRSASNAITLHGPPRVFQTLQSQSGRVSAPFRRLPVNRRPCSPPDITGAAVKHVPTFQSCKKINLKRSLMQPLSKQWLGRPERSGRGN